ncbi:bacillithiol biosynthesis deacetylase BshB1 [Marinicrinis sediminis]|uniref:Bacillithiol biosynthesis deacetylase BshB1 n=1 Tax=Marinicrinis sediminis TaxID=1652465 RepID=A0ABW5RFX1_9BACL
MTEKLDILVFAAHPDDAEIGMGGTILKYASAGQRVGICDLTRAEMSSNGTTDSRQAEAQAASERLQLAMRANLELPDRGLTGDDEQLAAIVQVIRETQPRLVFAPYGVDRHPDHVNCSRLVQEAVFNAKLRKWQRGKKQQDAWTVEQLYYYFINDIQEPDVLIDISDFFAAKMESLQAYRSQFTLMDTDSVKTPLTEGYLERVRARDYLSGQKIRTDYAEGFMSNLPIQVELL